MTYAIGYVIYGTPLNQDHSDLISGWESGEEYDPKTGENRKLTTEEEDLWFEDNDGPCGFTSIYSGNSDKLTGYCGVYLDEIDEANDVTLDSMNWKATPEQKKQALEKIANLHPKLRDVSDVAGHYIVWGTS